MSSNAVTLPTGEFDRFRQVLAEYDIVATGLETLSAQLVSCDLPEGPEAYEALQALKEWARFDRETFWRLQVSDDRLAELLAELERRGRGGDPQEALSHEIGRIKAVLSPLSYVLENAHDREQKLNESLPLDEVADLKKANLERLAFEVVSGATRLKSAPLRHIMDTTSRCNLRCVTCHQSETQEVIHYDLADVDLSALTAKYQQAMQVFIAGTGEPFLSRSAFMLASEARAAGAFVEAITNGTTLSRASRLLPTVDMLMVSMDGGVREVYDAIRRNASFDILIKNLESLTPDDRRKICFNVVVCKQNILTLGQLIEIGARLEVGHIHLQEMNGYLPWHGPMLVDNEDRAWLFNELPIWAARAQAAGVSLVCNLTGPDRPTTPKPCTETVAERLDTMRGVPAAVSPPRRTIAEVTQAVRELSAEDTPAILRAVSAATKRLVPDTSDDARGLGPSDEPLDWKALRDFVEADQAAFPHCLTTFAHMIVNGDGTTRSCCKVQNRMAAVEKDTFGEIWNAAPYVELRAAHLRQEAPRDDCRDCHDPVRFHFLTEILGVLADHDIDISLIRKPRDFPVPASSANHPLVRQLGSNAL